MSADLNFTSLICSRLCHDLVGPVGAISNGIELMEMEDEPEMMKDALDLLKHSAANASRRLKFLRFAFGSSGGDELPLPVRDARQAALDFFTDHRLELVWPDAGNAEPAKGRIRLALNLTMAGAAGLVRGGELTVSVDNDSLAVTGVHDRAALPDAVVEALEGRREAAGGEDARIIESFLARKLADVEGLVLTIEQSPGRFTIAAR
ncbi:MAG: hypothetical protein TEF_06880 [Rhizobiales bacterium NRL2]|jgi:histidine phosphotransferase ChpT|nr:MAG: hypothetical protein TEF_06880 [Rhizobiales bacterium NRL2]